MGRVRPLLPARGDGGAGADQCVSTRQPGGVIQVVGGEDGRLTLTITGTVHLGETKRAQIPPVSAPE